MEEKKKKRGKNPPELKVEVIGLIEEAFESLSQAEKDVFYRTLLDRITELYNADKNKEKAED